MKVTKPFTTFAVAMIVSAFFAACAGSGGGDDDTSATIDDDSDACNACQSTEGCTAALGSGWVCQDNCCVQTGDDTFSDDDADDDDTQQDDDVDDDTGDDDTNPASPAIETDGWQNAKCGFIDSMPVDSPTEFTFEFWVSGMEWDSGAVVVSMQLIESFPFPPYVEGWSISLNMGGGVEAGPLWAEKADLAPFQWHHIALEGNWVDGFGTVVALYLDGHLADSEPSTFFGIQGRIGLGCSTLDLDLDYPKTVTARIDEVRYSDIPRYADDFDPPWTVEADSHTLGLWHIDEGSGFTLGDSSGNGHPGTLTDETMWVTR